MSEKYLHICIRIGKRIFSASKVNKQKSKILFQFSYDTIDFKIIWWENLARRLEEKKCIWVSKQWQMIGCSHLFSEIFWPPRLSFENETISHIQPKWLVRWAGKVFCFLRPQLKHNTNPPPPPSSNKVYRYLLQWARFSRSSSYLLPS